MTFVTRETGWIVLISFGLAMILLTYVFSRLKSWKTKEGFLVAGRKVSWFFGGPSIAASWIWAGALFVSVQMAYQKGLAGIFWFTLPNIIALLVFVFLGPRIRKLFPKGFTLPQFILHKLGSKRLHKLYLIPFFSNQIIAVTFNIFAGATVISLITGMSVVLVMPVLALIALTYTLISGLEASIITDFLQMALILLGIFFIVPKVVLAVGGFSVVAGGFAGIEGIARILDPGVAFTFGIATSIGLISQSITDQQYWQRVFSLKKNHIKKAFVFGTIIFAVVPIGLSILGFIGASPVAGIIFPTGMDPSMIGVQTVTQVLPQVLALLFVIMMLAGLSSTIDSGISATASLWATDVARYTSQERRLLSKQAQCSKIFSKDKLKLDSLDKRMIKQSRFSMIGVVILSLVIAYASYFIAGFGIGQLFMISISIVAASSVPTILSLFWKKLDAKGAFWGILVAIVVGMPIYIYANTNGFDKLMAIAAVLMLVMSTAFCLIFAKKKK